LKDLPEAFKYKEIFLDRQLFEDYVAYGPRLRQAVAGLSNEDLTARPGPGNWSILELVLHLTDSEYIAIDRMKRMLIEDNPPFLYADETAYVNRLFSHEQSPEDIGSPASFLTFLFSAPRFRRTEQKRAENSVDQYT
jgi:uncharacterized damage-inducible protein DinB